MLTSAVVVLPYAPTHNGEKSRPPTASPASVIWLLGDAILSGGRWNLSAVLICLPLMARDGICFFMFLLASKIDYYVVVSCSTDVQWSLGAAYLTADDAGCVCC